MQAKHHFFDEVLAVRIPAGTSLLVFSKEELVLVRRIVHFICTHFDCDILLFQSFLSQLDAEENLQ